MLQIRKPISFLMSIVALVLMSIGSADALEFIYPEDGVFVVKSNYLIIKAGTDQNITGLIIDINGIKSDVVDISSQEYKQVFGDLLILEPSFDPGENKIIVSGLSGRKQVSEIQATIFYAQDATAPVPEKYSRFFMHTDSKEAGCVACHNMSPDESELSRVGARNPCASCHKRMLGKKHVHGPAGVFQCAYCHDANAPSGKYQVLNGDAACVECHDDMVLRSGPDNYVHGPVEAGLCIVCHDPHASDNLAQLVEPVNDLCLNCHVIDTAVHAVRGVGRRGHPLSGEYDPFHPQRTLSCISCHNPHEGKSPYYLQYGIRDRLSLCQKCHQK